MRPLTLLAPEIARKTSNTLSPIGKWKKPVGAYAPVVLVKFIPTTTTATTATTTAAGNAVLRLSGLFGGAANGLMRMSVSCSVTSRCSVAGVAIKFCRRNAPAAHLIAYCNNSSSNSSSNSNYDSKCVGVFHCPLRTRVPPTVSAVSHILRKFTLSSSSTTSTSSSSTGATPTTVDDDDDDDGDDVDDGDGSNDVCDLSDMAAVDEDGVACVDVIAPDDLVLLPMKSLTHSINNINNDDSNNNRVDDGSYSAGGDVADVCAAADVGDASVVPVGEDDLGGRVNNNNNHNNRHRNKHNTRDIANMFGNIRCDGELFRVMIPVRQYRHLLQQQQRQHQHHHQQQHQQQQQLEMSDDHCALPEKTTAPSPPPPAAAVVTVERVYGEGALVEIGKIVASSPVVLSQFAALSLQMAHCSRFA